MALTLLFTATRKMQMYKHILIATDGSELADRAVVHGLALAKEVKAPVTLVTVTQAWSALELAHEFRMGNPDPVHQFERMAAASAKVILRRRCAEGESGQRCLRTRPCAGPASRRGYYRYRREERLRPDCNGIARPPRSWAPSARQPSERSARAQQGASADRAVMFRSSQEVSHAACPLSSQARQAR